MQPIWDKAYPRHLSVKGGGSNNWMSMVGARKQDCLATKTQVTALGWYCNILVAEFYHTAHYRLLSVGK